MQRISDRCKLNDLLYCILIYSIYVLGHLPISAGSVTPHQKTVDCDNLNDMAILKVLEDNKAVCSCPILDKIFVFKIGYCTVTQANPDTAQHACECDCYRAHFAHGEYLACRNDTSAPCACQYTPEDLVDIRKQKPSFLVPPSKAEASLDTSSQTELQAARTRGLLEELVDAICPPVLGEFIQAVCTPITIERKSFDAELICNIDCFCTHQAKKDAADRYGYCVSVNDIQYCVCNIWYEIEGNEIYPYSPTTD